MRNDLVSIIIPAYNSGKYIEKCIESVLSQTYQNIEIIVVNDGSTDDTVEKVSRYKNIILLNKENGGLCSARNHGVKFAKGKYLAFLDSDDFLDKDFILELYKRTSGRSDELVMCDFLANGEKESDGCTYLEVEGTPKIMSLFLRGGIYNRTVNKLYPFELIKDVPFATGRDMLEDAFFTSHVLEKVNKIIRIPYAGYNYIRHNTSMTRVRWSSLQLDSYYSNLLEKDCVISRYIPKEDYEYFCIKCLNHLKMCMLTTCNLNNFDIVNKINHLVSFLKKSASLDKNALKFVKLLSINNKNSIKSLRKGFRRYIIWHASIKMKFEYLKRIFRIVFIKKR